MVLIMLLVLPAFAPWLPHGSAHVLHDTHANHHQEYVQKSEHNQSHHHNDHDHHHEVVDGHHAEHDIQLDVVSYFNEILHVDFQTPYGVLLKTPSIDFEDVSYVVKIAAVVEGFELASLRVRGPPVIWEERSSPSHILIPLYISTQRFRI